MTDMFASAFKDNYDHFKRHIERLMPNLSLSNSPQQACLTNKDNSNSKLYLLYSVHKTIKS